jgi:hypothetical protein
MDCGCPWGHWTLQEWIGSLSSLGAVGGIFWAAATYRADLRRKRAETLQQLFEKFYEGSMYKAVRKAMDQNRLDEKWIQDPENEEKLVDYLNFFEFMVSLEALKQIRRIEVQKLFAYYLDLMQRTPVVSSYVLANGFEELEAWWSRSK